MIMRTHTFLLALAATALTSCNRSQGFPIEPIIEFVSFSKGQLLQSSIDPDDNLFLTIGFTDGDGDIGSDGNLNLDIIDNRTGENYAFFRLPAIPEQGANNGVSGTIRLKLLTSCCIDPTDATRGCDDVGEDVITNEVSLNIVLTDRAGNMSNVLTTPALTLVCRQ